MELRFTRHAREQMAIRKISDSEVLAALQSYHTHYTDRSGNDIYVGRPGGRRVKVVVAKGSEPPLIITAAD
jgi:hypothetical protein